MAWSPFAALAQNDSSALLSSTFMVRGVPQHMKIASPAAGGARRSWPFLRHRHVVPTAAGLLTMMMTRPPTSPLLMDFFHTVV